MQIRSLLKALGPFSERFFILGGPRGNQQKTFKIETQRNLKGEAVRIRIHYEACLIENKSEICTRASYTYYVIFISGLTHSMKCSYNT